MSTSEGQTVTVGTASAKPGEVARGVIAGPELAAGTRVEMPVVVINGAKPGRVFWVNGAIHGDEPEGPLACQLAMRRIDPAKLTGAVIMVPVMNVLAFAAAERGNPLDTFSYDMNRMYPGKPGGYFTDRLAQAHHAAMIDVADLENLDPFGRRALVPRQGDLLRREPRSRSNSPRRWERAGAASCLTSTRLARPWRR